MIVLIVCSCLMLPIYVMANTISENNPLGVSDGETVSENNLYVAMDEGTVSGNEIPYEMDEQSDSDV